MQKGRSQSKLPTRYCDLCGTSYRPKGHSSLYCDSCKRGTHKAVNPTRLLNFALKELGLTKEQLTSRFKEYNLRGDAK